MARLRIELHELSRELTQAETLLQTARDRLSSCTSADPHIHEIQHEIQVHLERISLLQAGMIQNLREMVRQRDTDIQFIQMISRVSSHPDAIWN